MEDTSLGQQATGRDRQILRLDTDWYGSTRHELEHLYDRVPSELVLILDDYGFWQGARGTPMEFLDRAGTRLLLAPMASGRIAVKPCSGT